MVDRIRFDVLDYCSAHQTDLIFTYVYAGAGDDNDIRQFIDVIENNQGKVEFIELTANREDLIDRAANESRKRYKKLIDPAKMAEITEQMDIYSIPFIDSLQVNTSETNPDDAVGLIANKLKLIG